MHGEVEGEVSGAGAREVASVEAEEEEIEEEPGHATELCHVMVGRQSLGQMQAAVQTLRGHSLHCFSRCFAPRPPLYIPSRWCWKQSITRDMGYRGTFGKGIYLSIERSKG